jgi:hypothetical protein
VTTHEPGQRSARWIPPATCGIVATKRLSPLVLSRTSARVRGASWPKLSPNTLCSDTDMPLAQASCASRPPPRLPWAGARFSLALWQDEPVGRQRRCAAVRACEALGYSSDSSSSSRSSVRSTSPGLDRQSSTVASHSSRRRPGFLTLRATTSPRVSS